MTAAFELTPSPLAAGHSDETFYEEEDDDVATADGPSRGRIMVPDFEDGSACANPEIVSDWMSILTAENAERIATAGEFDCVFITHSAVKYIFTLCARLRLPQDVKFSAVLIYNQFLLYHIDQLYTFVAEQPDASVSRKKRQWHRIETKIAHQQSLRALSCLQVASKLQSYHESLSTTTVRRYLLTMGFAYTEEAVLNSELRVLKTIDFRPIYHNTPLVYAETLLKVYCWRIGSHLDTSQYWTLLLLLVDCAFLFTDEIYQRVLILSLGERRAASVTKEVLSRIKADWMLLGAGVIVATACCVDGLKQGEVTLTTVQSIVGMPIADIRTMATALLQTVIARHSVNVVERERLLEESAGHFLQTMTQ